MTKLLIIVPAYNEAPVIGPTLEQIIDSTATLQPDIVVIDDGSTDQTAQKAVHPGVTVLKHVLNRGLGGAIGTGLEYAKRRNYSVAVTLDADGQHDPEDIKAMIKPILNGQADVVIGTRAKKAKKNMPPDRRLLLKLSNLLTWLLFGQSTSDSLSGFRAFNRQAIQKISIRTERMEVSNEFFSEIKLHRLRLAEVPIRVIYTDYSRAKGQTNANAVNIVLKLLLRLFR